MSYLNILKKRGYIYQISDEEEVRKIIDNPKDKYFYIGFDPTADSLHLGSMFALMSVSHLAKAGLKPIILMGGATGLIGDPSGKTEMRDILSEEKAAGNLKAIEKQIRKIIPKDPEPIFINNADWLRGLNLIEFLRDIGRHFSVNRMLTQDCVRSRLEKGITYLEFSYMLLQAYDFVYLNKNYNCVLQLGGADQWGNMVMGMDLARRINRTDVHCFTFELMMTADGDKMGKSEKGTLWLDPKKTSPYEYYQFWINIDDRDVERFLYCYTYIDDKRIEKLCKKKGKELREAKELLAFEATRILHGEGEATQSQDASRALFSGVGSGMEGVPTFSVKAQEIEKGLSIVDLLISSKLLPSKAEARRLIQSGGAYINNQRVTSEDTIITTKDFKEGLLLLRTGKKKYIKVIIKC